MARSAPQPQPTASYQRTILERLRIGILNPAADARTLSSPLVLTCRRPSASHGRLCSAPTSNERRYRWPTAILASAILCSSTPAKRRPQSMSQSSQKDEEKSWIRGISESFVKNYKAAKEQARAAKAEADPAVR